MKKVNVLALFYLYFRKILLYVKHLIASCTIVHQLGATTQQKRLKDIPWLSVVRSKEWLGQIFLKKIFLTRLCERKKCSKQANRSITECCSIWQLYVRSEIDRLLWNRRWLVQIFSRWKIYGDSMMLLELDMVSYVQ